jgi:mannose-6-phosphate isomerase-like protein (cupin superfamily)
MVRVDDKPWGKCFHLLETPDEQIDLCEIVQGGFSSIHFHAHKENLFVVTAGELDILIYNDVNYLIDSYRLKVGNDWLIPAGMRHQFRAIKPTRLVEVYHRAGAEPVTLEDIHRFSENGVAQPESTGSAKQCE